MYEGNRLLGVWNPTKHTLTGLQALCDALAKKEKLLELEIYTLRNEKIDSRYAFDASVERVARAEATIWRFEYCFSSPNPS